MKYLLGELFLKPVAYLTYTQGWRGSLGLQIFGLLIQLTCERCQLCETVALLLIDKVLKILLATRSWVEGKSIFSLVYYMLKPSLDIYFF